MTNRMTKSDDRSIHMSATSLPSSLWYRLLATVAAIRGGAACYRVRYTGRENIPASGGVLVVSNHQSHFDPPLVGLGCPRRMNYVARETLFRFAPFRWLIQSRRTRSPSTAKGSGWAGSRNRSGG